jgi:hypothetical protein
MKAITPHYIDGKFVEPHGPILRRLGKVSSSRV